MQSPNVFRAIRPFLNMFGDATDPLREHFFALSKIVNFTFHDVTVADSTLHGTDVEQNCVFGADVCKQILYRAHF